MGLSGQQRKELQKALIDAFPNTASLEQMLLHELDKNLGAIAGEGSLEDVVYKLIQTANAQGWVEDLVRAACNDNPGNLKLKAITQELLLKIKKRKEKIEKIKQSIVRIFIPRKKTHFKIGIGIASISIVVILGIGLYQFITDMSIAKHFSYGEKSLALGYMEGNKSQGIKAYSNKNYVDAINFFEKARKKQPNDPETLIYLNNATIERGGVESYTIAVVVPMLSNFYNSIQTLKGVAQAQNEINSQSRTKLKVLIADDDNDSDRAKKIANFLVKQSDVFAVIGHYASDITLKTRDIYENGNLVTVTPGSTSEDLPRPNDQYFFRTIPSVYSSVLKIEEYLHDKKLDKVAIFYNSCSEFSNSFFKSLEAYFKRKNINIINQNQNQNQEIEFNLANPFFDASIAIEKANARGAKAFILIPDGGTSIHSRRNTFKLIKANGKLIKASGKQNINIMIGANSLFSDETLLLGEDVVGNLLITSPWIQIIVSKSPFTNNAQQLWGDKEISPWTVTAYDAAKVLIQGLFTKIDQNQTREKLRTTLKDSEFKAKGADKEIPIKFSSDGNRYRDRESVELAKIVSSKCYKFGYRFVPEEYQENKIKELDNSC
jgi:ABC-type branched-subunit amino acid transport system substrate-binding protein